MSSNTTVLITGANRGIGKGLVANYLSRPNYTVIAGVRDPQNATSKSLHDLSKGDNSKLVLVKIESSSPTDPTSAVDELKAAHGVEVLDIVIANAGINTTQPPVAEAKAADMIEHFTVNTLGVMYLFQATLPLLNKSKNPRFVPVSTLAASVGMMDQVPIPNTPYGASKIAVNYITRRIHFENTNLTVFPIHPGLVRTDMSAEVGKIEALKDWFEEHAITVEQSADGIAKVVDEATREKTSGEFMSYDGTVAPW